MNLAKAAKKLSETAPHLRQIRALESQLAAAKAEVKIEKHKREQAEDDLKAAQLQLETFFATDCKVNPKTLERIKRRGGGSASAVICANDWHSEENIEAAAVNGVNEYNLKIADARIKRLWQKSVYLIQAQRTISNIRDAVVWFGGDLINGYIHAELQEANFLGPTEAVLWVVDRAVPGLEFLLKEADLSTIIVPCSMGNHGRATDKPRGATGYKTNWEYMAYQMLARYFRNEPRVKFVVETGYHTWLQIQGHWCRFHHGDAVKFGGGVGGVHIPLRKKIAQWNKSKVAACDFLGHFHQFIDEWWYVVSGCVCGFNDYALRIGAEPQGPSQALSFIDKEYGKVATVPIFVERPMRMAA